MACDVEVEGIADAEPEGFEDDLFANCWYLW